MKYSKTMPNWCGIASTFKPSNCSNTRIIDPLHTSPSPQATPMRTWIATHLHLLYTQRLDYDWTKSLRVLDRVHVLEEYAGLAQPSGIRLALHMEADVRAQQMEAETDLI